MSRRCSTEVMQLRRKLVKEIAIKAKQLSDEDYKKFMAYLKECIAKDEEEENKSINKKLNDDQDV